MGISDITGMEEAMKIVVGLWEAENGKVVRVDHVSEMWGVRGLYEGIEMGGCLQLVWDENGVNKNRRCDSEKSWDLVRLVEKS